MKRYVIFNPAAGSVIDREKVLAALARLSPVKLRFTQKRCDAEKWAREAIKTNCDVIAVAGGDGTLNEVVNGLAKVARRTRIGIIPLGTGNDFARALGLRRGLGASGFGRDASAADDPAERQPASGAAAGDAVSRALGRRTDL